LRCKNLSTTYNPNTSLLNDWCLSMKIIFDYNRTIFDPEQQELYSGVFELITYLSVKHELFLISKNESGRKEKLDSFCISKFFNKIVFTDNKSIKIFKEIVGEENNVIVVGDRVAGEITIGNKLNLITVWLKQGKFSNEYPVSDEQKPKHIIYEISELKEIIKNYE